MELQLQAIVTLLALINPVMCAAIFLQTQEGAKSRGEKIAAAGKAVLAVLVILLVAALAGARILHEFGVSLDAFSVAGGGVLVWIGFSMLRGESPGGGASKTDAGQSRASLAPLIIFAAGPGTITGVITLAVAHSRMALPVTALVSVGVATLVMWLLMMLGIHLGGRQKAAGGDARGDGFVRDVATRFQGLVVIAMGVQFALTGIRAFFDGTVHP